MLNKIQCVSAVTALSFGGIALGFVYKRHFSNLIWVLRTKMVLRKNKKIIIINNAEQWENISKDFCREIAAINAVGFDCEWVSEKGSRQPIALMQLATYSGKCSLFRLNYLKTNIPLSLKEILENEDIVKVGVGIDLDMQFILKDYNIQVNGWLDLRHLARTHSTNNDKKESKSVERLGLNALARKYLGQELDKDWRVRAANWEAPKLTHRQINYAAEDALVGIRILLSILKLVWVPHTLWPPFRLQSWENITREAIETVCSSFVAVKFSQRHFVDDSCAKDGTGIAPPQSKIIKGVRMSYCTRKSPLYHNSQLWAPDGEPLCTCDPKKAYWYVEKGLGELVSEDPLVVKLKFEPAGRPIREGLDGLFYLQERFNLCVVCGKEDSYIRKNIIPHEYRKYFPKILKAHQSHDVVLLCTECHQISNIKDNSLRYDLAREFEAPIGCETDVKLTIDGRLKMIRSAGGALRRSKDQLPPERVTYLENILMEFFGTDILTENLIKQASELDTQIMNEAYIPHGYKVYQGYERVGLICLEERWRQWFLDSMQPKYMPDNWSISHNHKKLRLKMSRYPVDDPIREDYKIALVGTDGSIDVPYIPNSEGKPPSSFFDLNSNEEEEDSRENTPEESVHLNRTREPSEELARIP